MTTPFVSVVMCTFNAEKYIAEAIESVLTQTFKNFEFIIWDDGSTDGTRCVVDSFKDERIRYFYHENTGLGMALKLACAEARGKYIARMDSDDISLPERFEKEVNYLETHPEVVLVSSAIRYIDENGNLLGRIFPCSKSSVLKKMLFDSINPIVHPMVMMRTDVYNEAGGYLPIGKGQDALFWSRLLKLGKFYNLPLPLGKYRILSDSLDHVYNPYRPIFIRLLKKMMRDETILCSDIDLYNSIVSYSKGFQVRNNTFLDKKKKSREEYLFLFLCFLFGERVSEKIITDLKNIYYLIKLRNVKI